MVPEFVDRTRGSKWNRVLPGRRQQMAVGNADLQFAGSSCEFADLGRSNLWRPMVVDRTRGSNRQSALPTCPVLDMAAGYAL